MSNLHSIHLNSWEAIYWGSTSSLEPLTGWEFRTDLYETGNEPSILIIVTETQSSRTLEIQTAAESIITKYGSSVTTILIVPDNTLRFDFNSDLSNFYFEDNVIEKYLYKRISNHVPDAILISSTESFSLKSIVNVPVVTCTNQIQEICSHIEQALNLPRSSSRLDIIHKLKRTPQELAKDLMKVYGNDLTLVNYTQGVGVYACLHIAQQMEGPNNIAKELDQMLSNSPLGEQKPFGVDPTGANLASAIWAYDLSSMLGNDKWNQLLDEAANTYQFNINDGPPIPCDPTVRTEDMFYSSAILGRAFEKHDTVSYLDILDSFYELIHLQQENGLFWHSQSSPYFWSRGNGFAILGLSQYLTYVPQTRPMYSVILNQFLTFFNQIKKFQDISGGFHQVMDLPNTYLEFTTTCIIGYAALRGKALGILDDSVDPIIEGAWHFLRSRVDHEGNVTDACFNTGLQPDLESYYLRPAVSGYDDRSGSMALLFCAEILRTNFI
tara:strand:+ start:18645 stop:20132 length:1488 start_codon:yes stop_codon:yes gene_type:complete